MTIKMKPVDVVLTGVGWTGGILGKELAQAGLKVVGLERGRARDTNPDFLAPWVHDELRYHSRFELMQDLAKETLTFRNSANQVALPMRYLGSFYPGEGLGGAWRVIVLNDDHNTFDGVASALARVIPGVTLDQGYAIANTIHNTGQAIVWSGPREPAEHYWEQLREAGLTMAPLEQG